MGMGQGIFANAFGDGQLAGDLVEDIEGLFEVLLLVGLLVA